LEIEINAKMGIICSIIGSVFKKGELKIELEAFFMQNGYNNAPIL
jgi:hypothetical protein